MAYREIYTGSFMILYVANGSRLLVPIPPVINDLGGALKEVHAG